MTQQSFPGNNQPFSYEESTQPAGFQPPLERSELFALGAVAGAVVAAAISQYRENRRPPTALEQAQSQGAHVLETIKGATKSSTKQAQGTIDRVSEQLGAAFGSTSETKKAAKRSKKQQHSGLTGALVAALGGAAVSGTSKKAKKRIAIAFLRQRGEDPYAVSGSVRETLKEKLAHLSSDATPQGGLGTSLKTALGLGAATSAVERIIGDPYAVSGSIRETLKERAGQAGGTAQALGASLKGLAATASDATRGYAEEAQHYLQEAHLGEKARQYTDVAAEKAKVYGGVAAEKTKDLVTTAQKSLKDAQLDERLRDVGDTLADYTSEAAKVTGQAARQGVTKIGSGAAHLAEATTESADELRKGVRKSVKRTRRRTKWGIRAFLIGLGIGLLAAPRSGEATRDAVTSFLEDLLDVLISGEERSPIAR